MLTAMDDDLPQLEAELKRLRPAAPSLRVGTRIARELAPQRRRRFGLHWLWVAAMPTAAALAILALAPGRRPAAPAVEPGIAGLHSLPREGVSSTESALKPVAAENILYAAQDEGLVTLDDGTTARRERLNYVDTITWKNSHTNASLTWSVPREEVRVVPVNFQ